MELFNNSFVYIHLLLLFAFSLLHYPLYSICMKLSLYSLFIHTFTRIFREQFRCVVSYCNMMFWQVFLCYSKKKLQKNETKYKKSNQNGYLLFRQREKKDNKERVISSEKVTRAFIIILHLFILIIFDVQIKKVSFCKRILLNDKGVMIETPANTILI